ncbi:hypothetical protein ISN44_As11g028030 [Arabidopsis suecica]|uniref:Uncharacterized protein n=1 Tax=Arabidopsis suecica TaxID=45249 RepID=A0A8T1ZFC4_ARASU|nr:hypothetical protein ISN44_As11g028030 [Arabidopsis suecica]
MTRKEWKNLSAEKGSLTKRYESDDKDIEEEREMLTFYSKMQGRVCREEHPGIKKIDTYHPYFIEMKTLKLLEDDQQQKTGIELLDQALKPFLERETFLDRLAISLDQDGEPSQLA